MFPDIRLPAILVMPRDMTVAIVRASVAKCVRICLSTHASLGLSYCLGALQCRFRGSGRLRLRYYLVSLRMPKLDGLPVRVSLLAPIICLSIRSIKAAHHWHSPAYRPAVFLSKIDFYVPLHATGRLRGVPRSGWTYIIPNISDLNTKGSY